MMGIAGVVVLCLSAGPAGAVVDFNDGGHHVIDYVIDDHVNLDYDLPATGTSVDVVTGGSITGSLTAYGISTVAMFDGTAGAVEMWGQSSFTMYDGTTNAVLANIDSTVEILDGEIVDDIQITDNVCARIDGGSIGNWIVVAWDSTLWMSGGSVAAGFSLLNSGLLTLEGGSFTVNGYSVGYGDFASTYATPGIDGSGYSYLSGTVTGIFDNGDLLNNDFILYHSADITFVPEPGTILLFGLGTLVIRNTLNQDERT